MSNQATVKIKSGGKVLAAKTVQAGKTLVIKLVKKARK
jgi:hypothetical protein